MTEPLDSRLAKLEMNARLFRFDPHLEHPRCLPPRMTANTTSTRSCDPYRKKSARPRSGGVGEPEGLPPTQVPRPDPDPMNRRPTNDD